jgi:hypothetical protein
MTKKTVTAYWNQGGFYLEPEPEIRHPTERSMWRRAFALGFSHVCTLHGYYEIGKGFTVKDIPAREQRIPKVCRVEVQS